MTPEFARAEIPRLEARIRETEKALAAAKARRPSTDQRRAVRHRSGDLVLLHSGLRRARTDAVEREFE